MAGGFDFSFGFATQVGDPSMLDHDQTQLGQQHADKDRNVGGLEKQDADDGAGVEEHCAGHRQKEYLIHVEQCALAVKRHLDCDQQRAYAEHQLTGFNLFNIPARRQQAE